eukprot:1358072-Lingulodinium_polyedra.AAC.1
MVRSKGGHFAIHLNPQSWPVLTEGRRSSPVGMELPRRLRPRQAPRRSSAARAGSLRGVLLAAICGLCGRTAAAPQPTGAAVFPASPFASPVEPAVALALLAPPFA